jgi:hypothetical protein
LKRPCSMIAFSEKLYQRDQRRKRTFGKAEETRVLCTVLKVCFPMKV